MSLWQKLRKVLGMQGSKRAFELDQPLVEALRHLAEREHRRQDEVAVDLLSAALAQRQAAEVNLRVWRSLSSRQQQITALICLNYTNRQIAARLVVSTETVKSHVRNVLHKFNMHTKTELRQALAEWDFSEWQ
jgi:two-component system response regulator NreC